jgi:23S rRNA (adenine-N6)-dimethyltransferase
VPAPGAAPWWGWHRLEARWARRLVAQAGVSCADLVLDVGAGTGALTVPLAATGASVVAVELHDGRVAELRARFAGVRGVTVVRADVRDLRLPRRPFRVVANPPFGATTALVKRLVAPGSRLVRADLVVPYGVARRWMSAGAPGAGRWRSSFDVYVACRVPRRAFVPAVTMDCVVLVIERRLLSPRGAAGPGVAGGRDSG